MPPKLLFPDLQNQNLSQLAYIDVLTKLPNRLFLSGYYDEKLLLAKNCNYGAIYLDLDDFKYINDSLGHRFGDLVLFEVARRLLGDSHSKDFIARLGGDEFFLITRALSTNKVQASKQLQNISYQIQHVLEKPILLNGVEHLLSCTVGLFLFNPQQESLQTVLQKSDRALYFAKQSRQKSFLLSDSHTHSKRLAVLESDLHQAIKKDQFELFYQPQLNASQEMIGLEALLRWQHPQLGQLSPSEFLSLMDQHHFVLPICKLVIEKACKQIYRWRTKSKLSSLNLTLNIHPLHFLQADFTSQLHHILNAFDLDYQSVTLEFSALSLPKNLDPIRLQMKKLHKLGLTFSLDDVSDCSISLNKLTQLPIKQIKIDSVLVKNLTKNQPVIQTLLSMSQHLGILAIAEGVETFAQQKKLAQLGCHYYQGHYLCAALSAKDLLSWLKKLTKT